MARITDRLTGTLQPKQVVRDSDLRGFCARRAPDGRVTFFVRREGANKIFRVVGHSDSTTAAQARTAAEKLLARATLGQAETPGKQHTLDSAWPLFRKHLEVRGKSHRTIAAYDDALARLSPKVRFTKLRALSADPDIMTEEYARIETPPEDAKRQGRRTLGHGRAAADASARFVRALYRYTARRHEDSLPSRHPCIDLNLEVKKPIHPLRVLTEDDLPAWWRSVAALENPMRQLAHLFCLLSGLRTESLLAMRWDDASPDGYGFAFHIPKPKGGDKRAFDLVLSDHMLKCLQVALDIAASYQWRPDFDPHRLGWVWCSYSAKSRSGHLDGLESDIKRGVHHYGHALRRTYSSMAKQVGVDEELIGRLLNHKGKTITAHYIRSTAIGKMLLEAQNKISNHIIENIGGSFAWPKIPSTKTIP